MSVLLLSLATECVMELDKLNLVKLGYGGSVLSSSHFLLIPQQPQKNDARFKSGQKCLENNRLASLV